MATVAAALDGVAPGSRVVAAMSGGVDSSVVASLLKRLGYDVVGITLQLYDHGSAVGRKGACCAGQDISDARRVADQIGIPHYVLDYESRFRKAVIDTFADSYLRGETPIPCVACNQQIKFGDLSAAARDLGAAALVTGHYVGWRRETTGPALFRAADADRDQSYFLFSTPPSELEFVRFPLGGLSKRAVRDFATDAGLAVADKADSQDICFVPGGRYADVIERLRPGAAEPGEIAHVDGRVLGRHGGILNFTVGQRRGLGIAAAEPLYVVALDPESHRVIVGPHEMLLTRRIELAAINWLGPCDIDTFVLGGGRVYARVRSTGLPRPARLLCEGGRYAISLDEGEHGVARGQACVLYADGSPGARLLGGGWIARAESIGADARRSSNARRACVLSEAEQGPSTPG
ncbi:MAG: tRNA 2-thiouridine(34) synthase MnmA [Hyphomicrobiaceae bacterium]